MARLIPGPQDTVAMESISSRMLVDFGVKDPDFMPTIFSMFPEQANMIALLDAKGYKTKGVNYSSNFMNSKFRSVTNNHIQYKIAQSDFRKEHFRSNMDGVTFVDYANPTMPGYNGGEFYVFLDSNIVGGYEICMLSDGKTHIYMMDKEGGKEVSGGVFRYRAKIDGSNPDEYVLPEIMQEGDEIQSAYSKYPHDFSTGGNEKYFFSGYGDAYLTLQRFKYSYSGTAEAMTKGKVSGRWVSRSDGKGGATFITDAQISMMRQLARYQNFQLLEGKGTVSVDTKKVTLTNDLGQEILSGSGVLYSGDGPIEKPVTKWNKKTIEALLTDADTYIRPNELGKREAVAILHPKAYFDVMTVMGEMGVTRDQNIVGDGDDKILNNTYAGYSFGGLTIYFNRATYMQDRPSKTLKDGTRSNEHDCILLPLGLTEGGERGIQLVQLRPLVKGTVSGINKGGEVSNDVDGTTEHALIQCGVISQVQAIKTYKPIANNLID
jgi:hypothetical protein